MRYNALHFTTYYRLLLHIIYKYYKCSTLQLYCSFYILLFFNALWFCWRL
nr:MAG TPA: hypothetical protein [Caudoviricetes sp.]